MYQSTGAISALQVAGYQPETAVRVQDGSPPPGLIQVGNSRGPLATKGKGAACRPDEQESVWSLPST
jgi:hypothetical protein